MVVVNESVFNSRGTKRRRKLRLPHSLCEPCSLWTLAKMFLDVIREPRDLLQTVFGRNYYKDWLVETTSHDFHLAPFHQPAELRAIFRRRALQPLEQHP